MTGTMNGYNLTDQSWLPVETTSGRHEQLSLIDTFDQTDHIRRIDAGSETSRIAIHRLLIAIRLAAQRDGITPVDYLHRWRDRFDLFDDEHPFLQKPGLEPYGKGGYSLSNLLGAFAPNNDRAFTSMFGRSQDHSTVMGIREGFTLTPAQAAIRLLEAHLYAKKGVSTGCKDDPHPQAKGARRYASPEGVGNMGCMLMIERATLKDTLDLYATLPTTISDRPAWEREDQTFGGQREPSGILDLLTWRGRRVRLIHDGNTVTGSIVTAGDYCDRTHATGLDPMLPARVNDKGERYPVKPDGKQETRNPALWRLLADPTIIRPAVWNAIPTDEPVDVTACACLYDTHGTVLDDIQTEHIRVSRKESDSRRPYAERMRSLLWLMGGILRDMGALGGFDSDDDKKHLEQQGRAEAAEAIDRLMRDGHADANMIADAMIPLTEDWRQRTPIRARLEGADRLTGKLKERIITLLTDKEKNQ
ncbi:type I-E CRISPR-associated protein Cse1/CasA [Bifidobacterium sp. SO1]|uniref:type I-E CRISPR-associated protein Cse1/CasA n=1 Tax=Bifidobacterium sp. SO1 TaxID=2809029 RepID=UPI001BDC5136|nr:type I-E CRISPR-associated protein Cse1/CasA [Bifidobacterium sp. SO1]MBT1161722.1 type I-E CRISPR-associated protein Cse1/CasA [Bifidobacterium sp. SO1]